MQVTDAGDEWQGRPSLRLQGRSYSLPGGYFITLVIQQRELLLGSVSDGPVNLNDAGRMIERWWKEIPHKYPGVLLDQYVVMPNHIHAILVLTHGAWTRVRVNGPQGVFDIDPGRPHRIAPTLGGVIGWFKTMTTAEYARGVRESNWTPFFRRLWQQDFYEHIIRADGLGPIREYIRRNPERWHLDAENQAADTHIRM
ncbi:MAG: transposase [Chloroflexi bacterium]|nr:transposase [Chloroflexota bacterium]